jgi:hypothetical protein
MQKPSQTYRDSILHPRLKIPRCCYFSRSNADITKAFSKAPSNFYKSTPHIFV